MGHSIAPGDERGTRRIRCSSFARAAPDCWQLPHSLFSRTSSPSITGRRHHRCGARAGL